MPRSGYWMDETTGRDVVLYWRLDRDEVVALRRAYNEIQEVARESAKLHVEALTQLELELKQERRIAKAKRERALGQGLLWGAVLGVIVGVVAQ